MLSFRILCFVFLLNLIPIICPFPAFADTSGIRWEIENRFRYFKKTSDFRAIAKVYDQLKTPQNPKPSVLLLEQSLEKQGLPGGDPINGWAANIFENTCGVEPDHTYASCQMENGDHYLQPVTANLILYADGFGTNTCEWLIDDAAVATVPCNQPATAKNIKYDVRHKLEVQPTGGAPQSVDITLKDILLVSFGDSFSAGEGNPEKPVRLQDNVYDNYGNSWFGHDFPVREDLATGQADQNVFFGRLAAGWTNPQCHRSMYSQHTKAALQYALEHPHVTVTFINYSCTGAEVYEGILNAWWGRETDARGNTDDAPQLVKALRDLCKEPGPYKNTNWSNYNRTDADFNDKAATFQKCPSLIRNVDILLLSIGGNDVGFANMIVNSAVDVPTMGPLAKGRSLIYGLWRDAAQPQTFDQGWTLAQDRIPKRYAVLNEMLEKNLAVSAGKIILSVYPQIGFDETGKRCKAGTLGMDVHKIFGMNAQGFSSSEKFTDEFYGIMKRTANAQHWLVADQHVAQDKAPNNFTNDAVGMGHGICAEGPTYSAGGTMQFPRPKLGTEPPYVWRPFAPHSWNPYSARTRWFVTPNDAFLATNFHHTLFDLDDPVQPVLAATWSGAFHPNALGYAALADSVLVKLREALSAYEN
jgi:hypothetical protein